jgi:hypothetical protein
MPIAMTRNARLSTRNAAAASRAAASEATAAIKTRIEAVEKAHLARLVRTFQLLSNRPG